MMCSKTHVKSFFALMCTQQNKQDYILNKKAKKLISLRECSIFELNVDDMQLNTQIEYYRQMK
jgi:hypothetical protein